MDSKLYLSITQLGKIKHITTETLRHYDRIGLFRPAYVDPETRYRYYSLNQIEQIDTIIELRDMGMSLSDIRDFMVNRNVELSYHLLRQKEEELEKDIRQKRKLLKGIHEKRVYIEQLQEEKASGELLEWKICHLKEQNYIVSKTYQTEWEQYLMDLTLLKQNLSGEAAFIFATNYVGSIIQKESFFNDNEKQFARLAALPAEKCKKNLMNAKCYTMPEGEYLCITGNGLFRYGTEMERKVKIWLENSHKQVCGDIIEQDEIDMALTNEETEIVYSLKILVKDA